ncbi:MAG: DNA topoisomerase IV subunit A [Rhodospirillales bacterium]|nr:DNA topoisomerase IV subunit A [Rhodospirillales bacterium]
MASEDIRDTPLVDALSERYLAYALSTIMSRSLPDVRDGLKPVHRRLLHAMREIGLGPEGGYKKSARVVGDVIGKFHPHGDVAVYDALVRLAQDFAARYPLVDGQGNFGNVDGDNAAAMRYTEAKLTTVAAALLEGIDEDAVDFRPTYTNEDREPVVLPARFPNLLANGAAGIAVGMATSIPPHNVAEICQALLHLIKFPNATVGKLNEFIRGPDFPTSGILIEPTEAIVEAYKTGRGSFRLRARWTVEKHGHGLWHAVVTEIPYQVQKARLIERMAELISEKKLPLLADVRDESTADVRVVLEPRSRTVEPEVMMEQLFRSTELEARIPLNMNVLDATQTPRVMNLREVLSAFLEHRHEVLMRVTRHRLANTERRLEVLAGFLIVYLNLDKVIRIIRQEEEPKPKLMKAFKLTDLQAEAVLNMRLRQLRKLEEMEIRREHDELSAKRSELKRLLADKDRRWTAIAADITDIRKTWGPDTPTGRRRTEIGTPPKDVEIPLDVMIEKEPITVFLSEKGWIRAARGHLQDRSDIKYKEGDHGKFAFFAETTDKLVVFATNGRFYTVGCDKLPGGRGHGEPLRLMIDLANDQDFVQVLVHKPGRRLVIASDKGRGFIVAENDIIAQTRVGKQVLNLAEGERAVAAAPIEAGHDWVAAVGTKRKLIIFPLKELPEMTRGRGVILQRYREGTLSDVVAFRRADGLTWAIGEDGRTRSETALADWVGKRGQAGRIAPKGFSRANRFT